jgi:hypothetical protein
VITLAATDTNPGGLQSLAFAIASGPTHGTLTPETATTAGTAVYLYTATPGYSGSDHFTFTATDDSSGTALTSIPATVSLTITPTPYGIYAVGAGPGGGPEVKVYSTATGNLLFDFFAYSSLYRGGVQVAVGDVNGDGVPDIITGTGPGGAPHIEVFSGTNLALLASFYAFNSAFRGGVSVASGDLTGNGVDDVVVGAGPGAGPQVRSFQIVNGTAVQLAGPLGSFYAYEPSFTGGVNVAVGNVDGLPGGDEIVTGAASLGGPHVKVFAPNGTVQASYYAFPNSVLGVTVAVADVNGDGKDEIITGPGIGGGPVVQIFDGLSTTPDVSIVAYDANYRGGIVVAASAPTATGPAELLVAPIIGSQPVEVYAGASFVLLNELTPYDSAFDGGVSISGV